MSLFQDERTALHESARSQIRSDDKLGEIASILIKAGGDVNAKSSDLGEVCHDMCHFNLIIPLNCHSGLYHPLI